MARSILPEQSAAERRAAEAELKQIVNLLAPPHLRLCQTLRKHLRQRLPTAYELVYPYRSWCVISFSPSPHGYEGAVAIRASAEGVKLYFNRASELKDPAKILLGSGKQTRWLAIERGTQLRQPDVVQLLDQAVKLHRPLFPKTGCGYVHIRSKAAK